jgi:hypothetical protein
LQWFTEDFANGAIEQDKEMPFSEKFWSRFYEKNEHDIRTQGFIVEYPWRWTQFEDNDTGLSLTLLAQILEPDSDHQLAFTQENKEATYG